MIQKLRQNTITAITLLVVGLSGIAVPTMADPLTPFQGESGTVKVSGGTAHIPVMKEAAKRIMSFNSEIHITIAGGGSGVGIKQVGEGLVDIGNSGRKAKESEVSKYGLKMFKWAIDGVAVVVNPRNQVTSLSSDQLKDIYSGKVHNWQTLGGADKAITVYTRDNSSGTRAVFWKKALAKGDISDRAHFVVSNGAMKAAVSQDPYAIGYVSVGHIDSSVTPVALDGVVPTIVNVKEGRYTIARGLYSNSRGEPTGLTKKLIDYLLSLEGQAIVSDKGFIPVQ